MAADPVRTCVGCRQRFAVDLLVRITVDGHGGLVSGGSSRGRGVWLCEGSRSCLQAAMRSKAFNRGLKVQLTGEQERLFAGRLLDGMEHGGTASSPSTVVS